MDSLSADIFRNPEFFLQALSVDQNVARFVRMTPKSYRDSVMLDRRRTVRVDNYAFNVSLTGLLQFYANTAPSRRAVHYIFHNAFCGSTLLTRCIDALPYGFSLREPQCIYDCSLQKRVNWPSGPIVNRDNLLGCVTTLLSRTYDAGQTAVVKTGDACSNLIDDLRTLQPDSKMILLYSSLDHFVCHVLKAPARWPWVQGRVDELRAGWVPPARFQDVRWSTSTVQEAAALVWLVQRLHFERALSSYPASDVASLDYERLVADPRGSVFGVTELCGWPATEAEVERAIGTEVLGVHAKNGRTYDSATARAESSALSQKFESELADARRWLEGTGYGDWRAPLPHALT